MQQGRTEVSKAGGRKGVATPFLAKSSRKIFFFDFSTKKKTKFLEAGGALRPTRPPPSVRPWYASMHVHMNFVFIRYSHTFGNYSLQNILETMS
jgi:hypothetical protein